MPSCMIAVWLRSIKIVGDQFVACLPSSSQSRFALTTFFSDRGSRMLKSGINDGSASFSPIQIQIIECFFRHRI